MVEKRVFWRIFLKNGSFLVPEALNCINLVNYHYSQPLLTGLNLRNSSISIFGPKDKKKMAKNSVFKEFSSKITHFLCDRAPNCANCHEKSLKTSSSIH